MDPEKAVDTGVITQTRTFSILSVFRRSWRALRANPLLYLILALSLPLSLLVVFTWISPESFVMSVRRGRGLLYSLAFISLLTLPAEGAVAYAVYRYETGQRPSFGPSVLRALRYLPHLLGIRLIEWGLAVLFFIIFGLALSATFDMWLRITAFFFVLLLIETMWVAAVPACVIDGCGPVRSVNRSSELVRGCSFKIFVVIVLIHILDKMSVGRIAQLVTLFAFGDTIAPAIPGFVVGILLQAFRLLVGAALYFELCEAKNAELKGW